MTSTSHTPLLQLESLHKAYPLKKSFLRPQKYLHAVNNINLSINPGGTMGLVGESGCGKSTVASLILRLLKPDSGRILFKGQDISSINRKQAIQQAKIQAVFQDPNSSLDPRMTVEKIISYPLLHHRKVGLSEKYDILINTLQEVGLGPEHLTRFPHEFSGGQRQRLSIARALVVKPEFIVLDEPTSALDVSVQAQILSLLARLQKRHNYTYLFISHDLAVIHHLCQEIAVMYLGHLVERGPKAEIFDRPLHPYTKLLLASAPEPNPARKKAWLTLEAEEAEPSENIGCPFRPRCPQAVEICSQEIPTTTEPSPGHFLKCFNPS